MPDRKHETKRAINSIIREKGRFPNLLEMCQVLSFSERQTRKHMQALEEDGYLTKQGTWYKLPESFSKTKNVIEDSEVKELVPFEETVGEEKIKETFFETKTKVFKDLAKKLVYTRKKKSVEKINAQDIVIYGMPIYIIQVMMGIIGVGAAVISVYYTTIWLLEFLPWGFALLLSSIMVGFSISAFEASILFLSGQVTKNKISKISVVSGMIILWIVVSFFSIMSTVAGQYNKHILNLRSSTEQSRSTDRMQWNIIQEKKEEIKRRLSDYRQQMNVFTNIISGMNDVESRKKNGGIWYETQYKLKQTNKKIVELNTDMDGVRDKEKAFLEKSKKTGLLLSSGSEEKTKDFYDWLAGITGIVRDKVQFAMSLFPAIFVDLIAPIGIAMSLFLRNRYKKVIL